MGPIILAYFPESIFKILALFIYEEMLHLCNMYKYVHTIKVQKLKAHKNWWESEAQSHYQKKRLFLLFPLEFSTVYIYKNRQWTYKAKIDNYYWWPITWHLLMGGCAGWWCWNTNAVRRSSTSLPLVTVSVTDAKKKFNNFAQIGVNFRSQFFSGSFVSRMIRPILWRKIFGFI